MTTKKFPCQTSPRVIKLQSSTKEGALMRICSKCKQPWEFYRTGSWCKKCRCAAAKVYVRKPGVREKKLANLRRFYQKNREKMIADAKAYATKNREHIHERNRRRELWA